jgi:hypothetical protein
LASSVTFPVTLKFSSAGGGFVGLSCENEMSEHENKMVKIHMLCSSAIFFIQQQLR